MSHHDYSNHHGRPLRPSHTGTNSHSGSLYPEQGRTILPPLTIAFPTSDSPVSNPNYITTQRSTPVPYEAPYYPPAQQQQQQQQQQTHAPYLNYPSFQPLSETRHHGGQTYGGSYDRASPPSNLADPWRPPPLDVPVGGRMQGQAYYQYNADLQTPRTSNDLRSPHSVYSPASSIPQYQSPASPAYPAGHSPPRGTAAANTPQLSMAMSNVSLDYTNPMYRSSRPLPYARAPTAPSPVPYDVPPETQEPTIKKKRKRADARQLEALNRMYARTAFPSTEERQQLARDLDMSARSVQIWFQNKRQASRQGGRNPANSSATVPLPEDTPPVPRRSPGPGPGQPVVIHPRGGLATPVANHHRGSPAIVSPMGESSYRSRSPLPVMMRSGQTPSPPGGRSRADPRADMDPRSRQWQDRGY